jgi:capsular polysaccharide biosynthesis protein
MTMREIVRIIFKRWWLVVMIPAIVLPLLIVRARTQPYQSTFNAVVLIPGDTEIPGNSERPELMVMDDLPNLISSNVFAGAVATDLPNRGYSLSADDLEGSISGERYSRVLTVKVSRESAAEARAIAESAAAVLPEQVNLYLVADPTEPATVQVIDPPGNSTRSRPNQALVILAMTCVAAAAGVGLALLAHAWSNDVRIVETRTSDVVKKS